VTEPAPESPGADMASLGADYEALRRGIGAFRPAREVLAVRGPDALEYLQGQCSQDVAALAPGGLADSLLLAPDGKLVALIRVQRIADDEFVIDVAGGFGETVAARLRRFKLRSKLDLEPLDWSCVALRGAGAVAAFDLGPGGDRGLTAVTERPGARVLPVAWNGTEGVDLLGADPSGAVPGSARWCAAAAWEALRVEAGIPEMGRELDERTIAAEADLLDRTVSFTKGCYTGQELVARLDARGNRVARHLGGVVVDPTTTTEATSLLGAALFAGASDKAVGHCTSAAWCPGLGSLAALGYLHRSVEVPGPVTVEVPDADGTVRVGAEARWLPLR